MALAGAAAARMAMAMMMIMAAGVLQNIAENPFRLVALTQHGCGQISTWLRVFVYGCCAGVAEFDQRSFGGGLDRSVVGAKVNTGVSPFAATISFRLRVHTRDGRTERATHGRNCWSETTRRNDDGIRRDNDQAPTLVDRIGL